MQYYWITLGWLLFGLIHSLLATDWLKSIASERTGLTGKQYRQLYNVIAILTLILAVLLTIRYSGSDIVTWRGAWLLIPTVAWLLALVFFAIPARAYDLGQFVGTRPDFRDESLAQQGLAMTWCHRYVRHPWYFAILLILWFRNLSDGWLVANVCLTIYLVIGVVCEESRLISRFGTAWADYRKQVAALIPMPGRILSNDELRRLEQASVAYGQT